MANYQLHLNISQQDLSGILASGMRVVLARTVNGQANVAWVVFSPMISNSVEWNDDYALYASNTSIQQGAQIMMMSQTGMPAQSGSMYVFESSMTFSGPRQGGAGPGSYGIQNAAPPNFSPSMTFGLFQRASVNGGSSQAPLSATALMSNMVSVLTPSGQVYIWLQSNAQAGTIVNASTNRSTVVNFGNGVFDITMLYNGAQGVFVRT
jgi:hypothetical protein